MEHRQRIMRSQLKIYRRKAKTDAGVRTAIWLVAPLRNCDQTNTPQYK
uniref:Uncharacterized protein n=1 Tax=Physcomitrium patens TaxID=3218 RepID=A0A2K1KWK6_PHYPA|nr:hypothetical protein PHYPA_005170 [Physcomitrium patens]